MIQFLKISNLALLDCADFEFSDGFSVVTGETGAGKSVFLGALAFLAGNRANKDIIRNVADSCSIQAAISFKNSDSVDEFLLSNGIEKCEDNTLIISRIISRDKPPRIFINSSIASLSSLAKLGKFWIDFHGPGEPQKLFSIRAQLDLLDAFSSDSSHIEKYRALFRQYQEIIKKIDAVKNLKKLSQDECEFIKSQIASIDQINPSPESIAELERLSKLAEMSNDIVEKSAQLVNILNGENGAADSIAAATRLAAELADAGDSASELSKRLVSLSVEITDIADEYEALANSCDLTQEQISDIRKRMSDWLVVARKYGVSPDNVIAARNEMAAKIEMQSDVKASLAKFEEEEDNLIREMGSEAENILKCRLHAAKKLSTEVVKVLKKLGFKNPEFKIEISANPVPSSEGGSTCEFFFSANPGTPMLPLAKIASSGELARVMLAVKSVLADADETPVLVFDEVDANVGGEIGAEVGRLLAKISMNHQVFCVTHLPQVAACAKSHFLVEKFQTKSSTNVKISSIEKDENRRVMELARMLGDRNSESARSHAKRLLEGTH